MKTNLTKKIMSGLAIGCLTLSLGAFVAANPSQEGPDQGRGMSQHHAMPSPAEMEQHLANRLNKLVDNGSITKDQANSILNLFKQKASQRQADMEKMKDMSPDERHTYMEQQHKAHPDMIKDLMSGAGLSQEQAKTVADTLRPPKMSPEKMQQHLNNSLDKLVTEGTITPDQKNSVLTFLKEKFSQHHADMEKMKDMTPDERHAYMEQQHKDRPDMINELASATGLSPEQAKAVADELRPHHGEKHPDAPGHRPLSNS